MLKPSIDKLLEKSQSKYILVTAVSKRAHQIEDNHSPALMAKNISKKSIGIALEEIEEGYINIRK